MSQKRELKMNSATMEQYGVESKTMFPKLQGRKKTVIVGACALLIACALAAYWMRSDSSEPAPIRTPHGNDKADLSVPRVKTGFTVVGTVRINGQFPLGVGHVVAYDITGSRALAFSALDKMGNYRLTNVPPGQLILLVKRDISDDPNPVDAEMRPGLGAQSKPKEKLVRHPTGEPMRKQRQIINEKPPSIETMKKIRFDVSSPELENLQAVKWMIDIAFKKFGQFSETNPFVVPPGEGERGFVMELAVP